jgi:pimeloyl-ACP methyl ester carboxylesterase
MKLNRPFSGLSLVLFFVLSACGTTKQIEDPQGEFKANPEKTEIGFHGDLQEYDYPFNTSDYVVQSEGQVLRMTYMDVRPEVEKGTFLLLHGKNFNGAYFRSLAILLYKKGYRVIIPDQIGFGKSSKPEGYQFSFQELARQNRFLLDHLGIKQANLLGHSMGGMLAMRYALMYPETVKRLYLVNPIGLEDWKLSVPYRSIDDLTNEEDRMTPEKLRLYEQENYYGGKWGPGFEEWVQAPIGAMNGPDFLKLAKISALTTDMIFTQPVFYEIGNLAVPTTLIIGTRDRTAIGKSWAKPEVAAKLGDYAKLGRETAKKIRGARLIEMPGVGHVPFVEALPKFWEALSPAL